MNLTPKSIASAVFSTAFLFCLGSSNRAADDLQAEVNKQIDAVAQEIAKTIKGDAASIGDQTKIDQAITDQAKAEGITGGPAAKRLHDQVWAQVKAEWIKAQGMDPTKGPGKKLMEKISSLVAAAAGDAPASATPEAAAPHPSTSAAADAPPATPSASSSDKATNNAYASIAAPITKKIVDAVPDPTTATATAIEDKFKSEIAATNPKHERSPSDPVTQLVWDDVSTKLLVPYLKAKKIDPTNDDGKTALASFAKDVGMNPGATPKPESEESQYLSKFDTTYSSKAVLVTAHIASAYSPAFQTSWPTNIGFQLSTSLPAGSSSLSDYANNEFLLRDGGLINAYFSLGVTSPKNWDKNWGDRRYAVNRLYWTRYWAQTHVDYDKIKLDKALTALKNSSRDNVAEAQAKADDAQRKLNEDQAKLAIQDRAANQVYVYIPHGFGMKAVKTSLDKESVSLAGVGTAYAGIGVDGPLFDANTDSKGTMSMELFGAYNVTSKRALRALYGATNPALMDKASFGTWGAQAKFYIADQFYVSASYYKPINRSARDLIHEVSSFSFGYNSSAGAKKPGSGSGTSGTTP